MWVDVTYQGVVLQRRAELEPAAEGFFLVLAPPMPVGTELALVEAGRVHAVRVAKVHEGSEAGMFVVGASLAPAEAVPDLIEVIDVTEEMVVDRLPAKPKRVRKRPPTGGRKKRAPATASA